MKYLPFLTGQYTTAPGLVPIAKGAAEHDHLVFQINETYREYLHNKLNCRQENIHKYYCEHDLYPETAAAVNRYIIHQLIKEYPSQFTLVNEGGDMTFTNQATGEHVRLNADWITVKSEKYVSLFDALCSQVQEDIAIVQLQPDKEWLSAIHLCAPNHWSPGEKIGKSFEAIHVPVPAMDRTLMHYRKMLESIANNETPVVRFAWGIATDTRLNHHPVPPPGEDAAAWHGRAHEDVQAWYIRTERQTLKGFPDVNAFMFTIRTYFYSVAELNAHEKTKLAEALRSMTPETRRYKGVGESVDFLTSKLHD